MSESIDFDLHLEQSPGTTVVVVSGELDLETAPQLTAVAEGTTGLRLIIDMSGVSFVDSAGLRSLLRLRTLRELTHRVAIRNPSEPVVRLLKLAGVETLFDVEPDGRQMDDEHSNPLIN